MHRSVALVVLAASACGDRTASAPLPVRAWVYAPEPIGWPAPPPRARLGRSAAPQAIASLGITGPAGLAPLQQPTVWAIPRDEESDTPARAAVYGELPASTDAAAATAVELIDIDGGTVLWRDTKACTGPIVGVSTQAIVCMHDAGVAALSLAGTVAWTSSAAFVAMSGERVALIDGATAAVVDANDGGELARVVMPDAIRAEAIVAACGDAGHEIIAVDRDHIVVRIVEGTGAAKGEAVVAWRAKDALAGPAVTVDACDGDSILVLDNERRLSAYRRSDGARTGFVDGVRGWWRARGAASGLEIATADGVFAWSGDASVRGERLELPALGAAIATDGAKRLVRVDDETVVLLDEHGTAAYMPLRGTAAALGDAAVLAGSWDPAVVDSVRRYALPHRIARMPALARAARPVTLPAELRDMPAPGSLRELVTVRRAAHATAALAVPAIALDPARADTVYAATADGALVAFDVATPAVRWERADGCPPGARHALAVGRDVVVCAARAGAAVRATATSDAAARWEWAAPMVLDVQAHGDVMVVIAADRATVLSAATAAVLGHVAKDVAVIPSPQGGTYVVTATPGRVVAHAPELRMIGVWSVAVDGQVSRISAAGDGVLVELADGDAYRITSTGEVHALPGVGVAWTVGSDLLASVAPAPGVHGPAPDRGAVAPPAKPAIPEPMPAADAPQPPRLWVPIPPPAPVSPAVQVTLYSLAGAVRARNDYGVAAATPGAQGPAAPIVLLASGPEGAHALVVDGTTGDPLRRAALPERAATFSTVVAGTPITGAVVADPLRVVGF